jgi:hypothetical protein
MSGDYKQNDLNSDPEQNIATDALLANTIVSSFSWRSVNVTVKDKQSKKDKLILSNVNGKIKAGKLLQIA